MADKRDYYEVLGLSKNASADDIKKADLAIVDQETIFETETTLEATLKSE